MVEYHEIPDTNIIEFVVDGSFTAEDFDSLLPKVTALIEKHGKVRVIEVVKSFSSFPVTRLWEDMKFGYEHLGNISHVALVADKKWIEVIAKIVGPLFKAELKTFHFNEIADARTWIRAAE